MKSMTGFGRGAVSNENFAVAVEIKTVNNRFLDLNLRLSNELQSLEANIKKLIQSRLSRGRVDVFVNYERTGEIVYELNRPLISGYISALKQMQEEFNLTGEPDFNYIARLPNALQPKVEDLSEEFAGAIETAVNLALDELEQMREVEGESLKKDLENLLAEIESHLPKIEAESANVADEYAQRLKKRLENFLSKNDSQIEIDQARLAQEVAYLADKSDIAEEITRLKSHIEQYRGIMQDEKEVGKRLDFLTQELNREANTIASKTNNLIVKESALQIKSAIEKIREQVQNVE
ncbi:MAG: YicC family protein [Pyrinomonadaceae bacterium]|nr:YicC family protein [Pyrinomonadaceae bacterium]